MAPFDLVPVRLKPLFENASDHAGHAPPVVVDRSAAKRLLQALWQPNVEDGVSIHRAFVTQMMADTHPQAGSLEGERAKPPPRGNPGAPAPPLSRARASF